MKRYLILLIFVFFCLFFFLETRISEKNNSSFFVSSNSLSTFSDSEDTDIFSNEQLVGDVKEYRYLLGTYNGDKKYIRIGIKEDHLGNINQLIVYTGPYSNTSPRISHARAGARGLQVALTTEILDRGASREMGETEKLGFGRDNIPSSGNIFDLRIQILRFMHQGSNEGFNSFGHSLSIRDHSQILRSIVSDYGNTNSNFANARREIALMKKIEFDELDRLVTFDPYRTIGERTIDSISLDDFDEYGNLDPTQMSGLRNPRWETSRHGGGLNFFETAVTNARLLFDETFYARFMTESCYPQLGCNDLYLINNQAVSTDFRGRVKSYGAKNSNRLLVMERYKSNLESTYIPIDGNGQYPQNFAFLSEMSVDDFNEKGEMELSGLDGMSTITELKEIVGGISSFDPETHLQIYYQHFKIALATRGLHQEKYRNLIEQEKRHPTPDINFRFPRNLEMDDFNENGTIEPAAFADVNGERLFEGFGYMQDLIIFWENKNHPYFRQIQDLIDSGNNDVNIVELRAEIGVFKAFLATENQIPDLLPELGITITGDYFDENGELSFFRFPSLSEESMIDSNGMTSLENELNNLRTVNLISVYRNQIIQSGNRNSTVKDLIELFVSNDESLPLSGFPQRFGFPEKLINSITSVLDLNNYQLIANPERVTNLGTVRNTLSLLATFQLGVELIEENSDFFRGGYRNIYWQNILETLNIHPNRDIIASGKALINSKGDLPFSAFGFSSSITATSFRDDGTILPNALQDLELEELQTFKAHFLDLGNHNYLTRILNIQKSNLLTYGNSDDKRLQIRDYLLLHIDSSEILLPSWPLTFLDGDNFDVSDEEGTLRESDLNALTFAEVTTLFQELQNLDGERDVLVTYRTQLIDGGNAPEQTDLQLLMRYYQALGQRKPSDYPNNFNFIAQTFDPDSDSAKQTGLVDAFESTGLLRTTSLNSFTTLEKMVKISQGMTNLKNNPISHQDAFLTQHKLNLLENGNNDANSSAVDLRNNIGTFISSQAENLPLLVPQLNLITLTFRNFDSNGELEMSDLEGLNFAEISQLNSELETFKSTSVSNLLNDYRTAIIEYGNNSNYRKNMLLTYLVVKNHIGSAHSDYPNHGNLPTFISDGTNGFDNFARANTGALKDTAFSSSINLASLGLWQAGSESLSPESITFHIENILNIYRDFLVDLGNINLSNKEENQLIITRYRSLNNPPNDFPALFNFVSPDSNELSFRLNIDFFTDSGLIMKPPLYPASLADLIYIQTGMNSFYELSHTTHNFNQLFLTALREDVANVGNSFSEQKVLVSSFLSLRDSERPNLIPSLELTYLTFGDFVVSTGNLPLTALANLNGDELKVLNEELKLLEDKTGAEIVSEYRALILSNGNKDFVLRLIFRDYQLLDSNEQNFNFNFPSGFSLQNIRSDGGLISDGLNSALIGTNFDDLQKLATFQHYVETFTGDQVIRHIDSTNDLTPSMMVGNGNSDTNKKEFIRDVKLYPRLIRGYTGGNFPQNEDRQSYITLDDFNARGELMTNNLLNADQEKLIAIDSGIRSFNVFSQRSILIDRYKQIIFREGNGNPNRKLLIAQYLKLIEQQITLPDYPNRIFTISSEFSDSLPGLNSYLKMQLFFASDGSMPSLLSFGSYFESLSELNEFFRGSESLTSSNMDILTNEFISTYIAEIIRLGNSDTNKKDLIKFGKIFNAKSPTNDYNFNFPQENNRDLLTLNFFTVDGTLLETPFSQLNFDTLTIIFNGIKNYNSLSHLATLVNEYKTYLRNTGNTTLSHRSLGTELGGFRQLTNFPLMLPSLGFDNLSIMNFDINGKLVNNESLNNFSTFSRLQALETFLVTGNATTLLESYSNQIITAGNNSLQLTGLMQLYQIILSIPESILFNYPQNGNLSIMIPPLILTAGVQNEAFAANGNFKTNALSRFDNLKKLGYLQRGIESLNDSTIALHETNFHENLLSFLVNYGNTNHNLLEIMIRYQAMNPKPSAINSIDFHFPNGISFVNYNSQGLFLSQSIEDFEIAFLASLYLGIKTDLNETGQASTIAKLRNAFALNIINFGNNSQDPNIVAIKILITDYHQMLQKPNLSPLIGNFELSINDFDNTQANLSLNVLSQYNGDELESLEESLTTLTIFEMLLQYRDAIINYGTQSTQDLKRKAISKYLKLEVKPSGFPALFELPPTINTDIKIREIFSADGQIVLSVFSITEENFNSYLKLGNFLFGMENFSPTGPDYLGVGDEEIPLTGKIHGLIDDGNSSAYTSHRLMIVRYKYLSVRLSEGETLSTNFNGNDISPLTVDYFAVDGTLGYNDLSAFTEVQLITFRNGISELSVTLLFDSLVNEFKDLLILGGADSFNDQKRELILNFINNPNDYPGYPQGFGFPEGLSLTDFDAATGRLRDKSISFSEISNGNQLVQIESGIKVPFHQAPYVDATNPQSPGLNDIEIVGENQRVALISYGNNPENEKKQSILRYYFRLTAKPTNYPQSFNFPTGLSLLNFEANGKLPLSFLTEKPIYGEVNPSNSVFFNSQTDLDCFQVPEFLDVVFNSMNLPKDLVSLTMPELLALSAAILSGMYNFDPHQHSEIITNQHRLNVVDNGNDDSLSSIGRRKYLIQTDNNLSGAERFPPGLNANDFDSQGQLRVNDKLMSFSFDDLSIIDSGFPPRYFALDHLSKELLIVLVCTLGAVSLLTTMGLILSFYFRHRKKNLREKIK